MRSKSKKRPIPLERIEACIVLVRGERVLLSNHLAVLYEVESKVLIQAVKRNRGRFPDDFMFQLTWNEAETLRSQNVILDQDRSPESRSQVVTLKRGENIKYRPYAFTEQGVAMLSSVLHSSRAVQVNIEIMRTFVKLREMLAGNRELSRKLEVLERKYDAQFKVVFDAIRELMRPPTRKPRPIGFAPWPNG